MSHRNPNNSINAGGELFRHLENVLPEHRQIILKIRDNLTFLYSGDAPETSAPMWTVLLRTSQGGLRQVSQQWLVESLSFLEKCKTSPFQLVERNTTDAFLAYRLGHYALAEKLAHNTHDNSSKILQVRIKIAKNEISEQELETIVNQYPTDNGDNESLLASYLVHQVRLGFEPKHILEYLETWLQQNESSPLVSVVRLCHILNALNYANLKRNNVTQVLSTLSKIEEAYCPRISDLQLKHHVLGNSYYHRALCAKLYGETDEELQYLHQALSLDHGFTDYYYRIAQIYHDRGDFLAKSNYENALLTSCFGFAVVNDYGVFLNEFGIPAEMSSWEKIAHLFFADGNPIL